MFNDHFQTEYVATVIPDTATIISDSPFTLLTNLHTVQPIQLQGELVQLKEGSSNRPAVHEIVSRYFTAPIQCNNVVDHLDSLPIDGSVTLIDLVINTTSKTRPTKERRIQMLEELQTKNLFTFSRQNKSIFIRKGAAYEKD